MRILLDTNVFIPLEDSSIELTDKLAKLSRLASGTHNLLIHPASYEDIQRDKDEERRNSMLRRLRKYEPLESPPQFDKETEAGLFNAPKKPNDTVDNLILYALHKNCVHWLVTQDSGIHKKARKIGEYERVLTIDQVIAALSELETDTSWEHPHIEDLPCHSIEISNGFFDSLRHGYGGSEFDTWYKEKCCQAGRKAWVCREDDDIHAICIYKPEEDEIVTNDNRVLSGKSLKLCTFKVDTNGYKLGELMLKQAFHYSMDNGVENVYATLEPKKHKVLEDLLTDFGFFLSVSM